MDKLEWISRDYEEINVAYFNLESLDALTESILNILESSSENIDKLLDKVSRICEYTIKAKKCVYTLQTAAAIAIQYHEISDVIMLSIETEISDGLEEAAKIKDLSSSFALDTHKVTFQDILHQAKDDKRICLQNSYSKDLEMPLSNRKLNEVVDQFLALSMKVDPINASISYIPQELELFSSLAKQRYPSSVLELIEKYESLVLKFSQLDMEMTSLEEELIGERWKHVFDCLGEEIEDILAHIDGQAKEGKEENELNSAKNILDYLSRILVEKLIKDDSYRRRYDRFVNRVCEVDDSEVHGKDVKIGPTSDKPPKVFKGQNFINSLDIKPIMVEGPPISIRKPRSTKDFVLSMNKDERSRLRKDSKVVIDKLLKELDTPADNKENESCSDPEQDLIEVQSFYPRMSAFSSTRTPMRVKNVFDSPNPFVTPSIKANRRSRLPMKTPTEKPMRYVPLPVTSIEPRLAKLLSLDRLPVESTLLSSKASRIPLPMRPQSRVSIRRSDSRLSVRSDSGQGSAGRPPSRLEELGLSISSRNGTRSPSVNNTPCNSLKVRPRTALGSMSAIKPNTPSYAELNPLSMKIRGKGSKGKASSTQRYRSVSCNDF
ncbi:DEKNAAC104482 [Brettanomyces naardenensis]|uniref:DEKNAAC104482 n=1 Tax=Brettanomyces naardenensis TaxID=13370 RepID=A0A448YRA1_BRENA|nr:DEKNAAC104482 [Brettanomyces naardenensis]